MYTPDGWLTPKAVKVFFIVILCMAILGTLSSCKQKEEVYYLQVNDYMELSICVYIVDSNENQLVLLDRDISIYPKDEDYIIESLETQPGFHSIYEASEKYWNLIHGMGYD